MTFTISESTAAADIKAALKSTVEPVQDAMARRFHEMTLANFGIMGPDRPIDWAPLSWRYAQKVGRSIATLVVDGTLKGAVHCEGNRVYISNAEVPYALIHQYGSKKHHMPPRPYFPIDQDGECMPYTYSQVMEAAINELNKQLS